MTTLPSVFSDGMVLQKVAKVWGFAVPRQSVTANFLGKKYKAVADENGRFCFTLKAERFGGPHSLTIEDIVINDVYIGHVWFCGGQSNMEGSISRTRFTLGEYIVPDSLIRIFQAGKGLDFEKPQKDVSGKWNTATGEFLDEMYAVPYFFARNLLASDSEKHPLFADVPIGLVCAPAGGTPIEGWLPEEIVKEHSELYKKLLQMKKTDIQKTTEESEKKVNEWHKKLREKDLGVAENWHAPDYDDSNWETRALLDPTGSPKHGVFWMRKRFTLPKVDGKVILNFGRIEHSVTVYINGIEVVNIGYQYPPCSCTILEGLLVEGKNLIAVRVVGGNPKVVPGKDYELLYSGGRVNFTFDKWKWRTGAEAEECPTGAWFYGYPCGVYNFMLAPLLGYSVDGMIWYQGESNTGYPHSYKALFTKFVKHVREQMGENLPVIFTQLANYIDPGSCSNVGGLGLPGSYWAILREQQRQCLKIFNTAMAVAIDCGEYNDLHPADKKSVGDRLALHARRMVYGEDIVSDGPAFKKMEYIAEEEKIVVHFTHGEGLWAKNGQPTLSILYKDGNVHSVTAAIRDGKLVATVRNLAPKAVRFGWEDCPSVSIYNAYGLPSSPFEEIIKETSGVGGY